jgi:hypothetical protein
MNHKAGSPLRNGQFELAHSTRWIPHPRRATQHVWVQIREGATPDVALQKKNQMVRVGPARTRETEIWVEMKPIIECFFRV